VLLEVLGVPRDVKTRDLCRASVGRKNAVSIRIVVDLPAPSGPTRPKISPSATSRSRPSTATTSPNVRRRPWAWMAGEDTEDVEDLGDEKNRSARSYGAADTITSAGMPGLSSSFGLATSTLIRKRVSRAPSASAPSSA